MGGSKKNINLLNVPYIRKIKQHKVTTNPSPPSSIQTQKKITRTSNTHTLPVRLNKQARGQKANQRCLF